MSAHLVKFSRLPAYVRAVFMFSHESKKLMKSYYYAMAEANTPLQEGFSMRRENLFAESVHTGDQVFTPVVLVTHSGTKLRFMVSSEPTERAISMEKPVELVVGSLIYQYIPDENFSEERLTAMRSQAYILARFYQLLFS